MKTLYRSFFLLMLPFFLTNCVNHVSPELYNPATFASDRKGVVILRATEDEPRTLNNLKVALPYRLKKMGEEKVLQVTRNANFTPTLYDPRDYDADMITLEPGVYYIDYLTLNSSTDYSARWYPGPGLKKIKSKMGNKYLVTIGAFEVKPGQVLYLGHANMSTGGELPFNILNEIDEVKAYLQRKGFNDLAKKIQFKPLFQVGSGIIERNGKISLIDAGTIQKARMAYFQKAAKKFPKKVK